MVRKIHFLIMVMEIKQLLTLKDIFVPVFDVNASDHEGQNITYGLTGNGPDDANFSIDPATGIVTFNAVPDYEDPWGGNDLNGSNTYHTGGKCN